MSIKKTIDNNYGEAMEFIVLKGPANCGKSRTCKELKQIFEKKHNVKAKEISYEELGLEANIEKIYYFDRIEKYSICIVPPGDVVSEVQKIIHALCKRYKIDIFYVTDRSHRKNGQEILRNYKKDKKIVIFKSYIDWHGDEKNDSYIKNEMDENNKMTAEYLYGMFKRKYL